MTTVAAVNLWGRTIGAVSLVPGQVHASFEYTPEFLRSGIEVSPLVMPLAAGIYRFPELPRPAFHGLPGLLADSLPDRFGNILIDAWLATQGRRPDSFNAIERLCYTGTRGMGALEFEPASGPERGAARQVDLDALVALAGRILTERRELRGSFGEQERGAALTDILQVGTSAGGARAKAIIAWNEHSNEVRSGQVAAGEGFGYWILKFDGVTGNRDKELDDPTGYGAIEYAYYLMAVDAGIDMPECRLLEEHGRRHFMARRFDRLPGGAKLHMQSLGSLAHYDYNAAGAYAYEQAFMAMRSLGLPMTDMQQQFRRMVFNIVARNQDDHVKNIAFLMDKAGHWSLSPAFDVTYSYNPAGDWTATHQISMNGKRDNFSRVDFRTCAQGISLPRGRADEILDEVCEVVSAWPDYAARAGVAEWQRQSIREALRLHWPKV